jgi:hypothetical protein
MTFEFTITYYLENWPTVHLYKLNIRELSQRMVPPNN